MYHQISPKSVHNFLRYSAGKVTDTHVSVRKRSASSAEVNIAQAGVFSDIDDVRDEDGARMKPGSCYAVTC